MLSEVRAEFRRYRRLGEDALTDLDDRAFFERPGAAVNPIALIVKHIGGNLRSRWTDFLTSDGEKADRNRDSEFEVAQGDSRDSLMQLWNTGWSALETALAALSNLDLDRTITIRGEALSVREACLRSVTHTAYHVGQILYVARLLKPDRKWLTIPPGESGTFKMPYLERNRANEKGQA